MPTQLTAILENVREILRPAGMKGMHVDAISAAAVASNMNLGLNAEDFSRKIQSALASNLRLTSQKPSFVRIKGVKGAYKKGWYRVKVESHTPVAATVEPPETEKAFLGKAGELAVISELLFWGYNASAMLVDSGIDVVASKAGKYFHLQVKTSTDSGGRFYFTIKHSSFSINHNSSTFYVFVLRRGLLNEYVILPSTYVHALIAGGKIVSGTTLSITITVDEKGRKYLLNTVDVGIYVGNFGGLIV